MDTREAERKLDEWVNDDDCRIGFDEKREIRNAIDWERSTLRATIEAKDAEIEERRQFTFELALQIMSLQDLLECFRQDADVQQRIERDLSAAEARVKELKEGWTAYHAFVAKHPKLMEDAERELALTERIAELEQYREEDADLIANMAHEIVDLKEEVAVLQHKNECAMHESYTLPSMIERLECELAEATAWNSRVSVCSEHTSDIVDGECLVCQLAEAKAERARYGDTVTSKMGELERELAKMTASAEIERQDKEKAQRELAEEINISKARKIQIDNIWEELVSAENRLAEARRDTERLIEDAYREGYTQHEVDDADLRSSPAPDVDSAWKHSDVRAAIDKAGGGG